MKTVYIVRGFWDEEAHVWCAEGVNFMGLATSAETLDALFKKVPLMICDLIEAEKDNEDGEIPMQLLIESAIAHRQTCA